MSEQLREAFQPCTYKCEAHPECICAEQAALAQPAEGGEAPLGAILNGREYARRLTEVYNFRDNLLHPLSGAMEWDELLRCFEHLAEYAQRTTPPASQEQAQQPVAGSLFCDMKTDEDKANFFLSGRGNETGVIAKAIQNDVAMAYQRCANYAKVLAQQPAACDGGTCGIGGYCNECPEVDDINVAESLTNDTKAQAQAPIKCRVCGGAGKVEQYTSAAAPKVMVKCPGCAGDGKCRTPQGCDQHGCHGGCLPVDDPQAQAQELPDEREAFEAWAIPLRYSVGHVTRTGEYIGRATACAWEAWKARAALAAKQERKPMTEGDV